MAGHARVKAARPFAACGMYIGVADAAEFDFNFNIVLTGIATFDRGEFQRGRTVVTGIG
jgi:hypothetical protein